MTTKTKKIPDHIWKLAPRVLWVLVTAFQLIIVLGCVPNISSSRSGLKGVYAVRLDNNDGTQLLIAFHAICRFSPTTTICTGSSFKNKAKIANDLGMTEVRNDILSLAVNLQSDVLLPIIDVAGVLFHISFVALLLSSFFKGQSGDASKSSNAKTKKLNHSRIMRRVALIAGSTSLAFSIVAAITLTITYGALEWAQKVSGTGTTLVALLWTATGLTLLYLISLAYVFPSGEAIRNSGNSGFGNSVTADDPFDDTL